MHRIPSNVLLQSVTTGPMDITVLTTVAVTVCITLHVTNRLDTVTKDVIRDIQTKLAVTVCS